MCTPNDEDGGPASRSVFARAIWIENDLHTRVTRNVPRKVVTFFMSLGRHEFEGRKLVSHGGDVKSYYVAWLRAPCCPCYPPDCKENFSALVIEMKERVNCAREDRDRPPLRLSLRGIGWPGRRPRSYLRSRVSTIYNGQITRQAFVRNEGNC